MCIGWTGVLQLQAQERLPSLFVHLLVSLKHHNTRSDLDSENVSLKTLKILEKNVRSVIVQT